MMTMMIVTHRKSTRIPETSAETFVKPQQLQFSSMCFQGASEAVSNLKLRFYIVS